MRDPCDNRTVSYLDCISVSILVVILNSSFVRCYHWGKVSKGYVESLYYFFITAFKFIMISKCFMFLNEAKGPLKSSKPIGLRKDV